MLYRMRLFKGAGSEGMAEPILPTEFVERMQRLLGEEATDFFEALQAPPMVGVRLNTLKCGAEVLSALAIQAEPLAWAPEGYVVRAGDVALGRHAYHAAGCYYLQDPSAMMPVALLNPQPGEAVLDIAAAPGGKATFIATRMQGRGLLVANEVVRGRVAALVENMERFGVANALVTNEAPARLAEVWAERFDAVLVDAPCSGEGMFRKNPEAATHWSATHVLGCAVRQQHLLDDAARLVRPGGRLVYATCTFAPEENEAVIARFLRTHPDFELVEPPAWPGSAPGRPDWVAPEEAAGLPLERCVRLWPHRAPGEGHFAALLRRRGEEAPWAWREPRARLSGQVRRHVEAFWRETMRTELPETGWAAFGDAWHLLPVDAREWRGVTVVRAGLRVGVARRGRFEPAHALALHLAPQAVRRVANLNAEEAQAYLRGETINRSGEPGWTLVAVDGYALGWGKQVGRLLKNHYPKGLRW